MPTAGHGVNRYKGRLDIPVMTCTSVILVVVPCLNEIVTLFSVKCVHSMSKSAFATIVSPELGFVITTAARLNSPHDEAGELHKIRATRGMSC
jgi:hypothetical protein